MKNILINLGLSTNEISVYQALIKIGGSSSAGDIIKLTDLHRNIVYDALTHLKNKNLLQEVQKDKKKFFRLKDPQFLVTEFEDRILDTNKLSKVISSLPNIYGIDLTVYEGSTACQEAWQNIMRITKPKSIIYTIGMAGDNWVSLMGETFIKYEQWALKNKIIDKIISQKNLKSEIEAHQNIHFRDISYVDIDLPLYVTIEIFDDRCFFEIYENSPSIIEIKNDKIVKTFKAYFNLLKTISDI